MQRRSLLQSTAVVSGLALAGCMGFGSDGNSDTVLDPPEREYDVDPEDLAYPAYGQELPGTTLPSPLHDTEISTREFVGSRETLVTFVFTRCPGPCPAMTTSLAQAQVEAEENSYTDEIAFVPITFDPEYDTPDRMEQFCERNGADPMAENWQFLRPESVARAEEVVTDQFGIGFEKVPIEESGHGNTEGTDSQDGDGHGETDGEHEHGEEAEHEMTFAHSNLLLLVNRDGFVERAYTPQPPRPDLVIDDLEAVREGYE